MKKAILISCFDWYDIRLKHIEYILKKNNFEVIILCSDFDHAHKRKIDTKKEKINYICVPTYKKNLSIKRFYSHKFFADKVYGHLSQNKYDLIYCLLPPNSLAHSIKKIKKFNTYRNSILLFDVIDLWPESLPINHLQKNFLFSIWRNLRNNNLDEADCVFTECNLYIDRLSNIVSKDKIHTLYLTNENEYYTSKFNLMNDTISFCYLGSINNLIDIDAICNVLKYSHKTKKVELNIIGGGSKTEELIRRAKQCQAKVNYYGVCFDYKTKKDVFSKSHYGLNLYKSQTIGLTIKSLDYMCAGLPIINSVSGDTSNLVKQMNIGINYDEFMESDLSYDSNIREHVYQVFKKNFSVEAFKLTFEYELKKIISNKEI